METCPPGVDDRAKPVSFSSVEDVWYDMSSGQSPTALQISIFCVGDSGLAAPTSLHIALYDHAESQECFSINIRFTVFAVMS